MPEVSAPRGVGAAVEPAARPVPDNRVRTGGSSTFAVLLRGPGKGLDSALGPVQRLGHSKASQTSFEAPAEAPQGHRRRHAEDPVEADPRELTLATPEGPLDPLFCQLAMNQGLTCLVQPNPSATVAPAALPLRDDLQNLIAGLARRAAWGGDRRKGSARIELSEGALAGATLVVHAEERTVSVELELPSGVTARDWQHRIATRLEARGFAARVKVA